MTSHMIWALMGFGSAMVFVWVYYILKTRGVKFFWYHPLLAGMFLLFVLYLLESVFSDLSEAEIQTNWNMMMILGVPLAAVAAFFLYRGFSKLKK